MTVTNIEQRKDRAGTAAEWVTANPVLLLGEHGLESDTGKGKVGDGTSAWISLPYSQVEDLVGELAAKAPSVMPTLTAPNEVINIAASAATGTVNVNVETAGLWYYTTAASANFTLNFRQASATTLNAMLAVGEAVTVAFMCTNGATPYYPTAFQVDGASVTPKWQGGVAPTAGNANAIDAYTFTIIKTGSAAFTVLASYAKYS